eukprot:1909481-Lingulodinium_polyedra.AAC.1
MQSMQPMQLHAINAITATNAFHATNAADTTAREPHARALHANNCLHEARGVRFVSRLGGRRSIRPHHCA